MLHVTSLRLISSVVLQEINTCDLIFLLCALIPLILLYLVIGFEWILVRLNLDYDITSIYVRIHVTIESHLIRNFCCRFILSMWIIELLFICEFRLFFFLGLIEWYRTKKSWINKKKKWIIMLEYLFPTVCSSNGVILY